MKKLIAFLLSAALVFALSACAAANAPAASAAPAPDGSTQESASAVPEETAQPSSAPVASEAPTDAPQQGNVLVVYFSGTGNTERVAGEIAEATGGDLFELVPEQPYTSADLDWTDSDSRVSREHDDESLRNVPLTVTEVSGWDSYDTVFLGYPIWWGGAAWPVNNFVTANDFTGKTVIPFATSASSGLGQSAETLAALAGTGDWQEGRRFSSGASAEEVQAWISELGL